MKDKTTKVTIWLKESSQPIIHEKAINTYEKGSLFCVYEEGIVHKYPIANIWRIADEYPNSDRRKAKKK